MIPSQYILSRLKKNLQMFDMAGNPRRGGGLISIHARQKSKVLQLGKRLMNLNKSKVRHLDIRVLQR